LASWHEHDFITITPDSDVDNFPRGGKSLQITVVLKRVDWGTHESEVLPITRAPNLSCNFMLRNVVTTQTMDMIGTLKFSVLDTGAASATELEWLIEGMYAYLFAGTELVFSGVIRRVTKNVQNGFNSTNRVNLWDIECDSDLAQLRQFKIDADAKTEWGSNIVGSPGIVLRKIMSPDSGGVWVPAYGDFRGIINDVDINIAYQLNSSSLAEDAGSQYEHLMVVHQLTNYDLRVNEIYRTRRYDFMTYEEEPVS
jgi:hypothetical protein